MHQTSFVQFTFAAGRTAKMLTTSKLGRRFIKVAAGHTKSFNFAQTCRGFKVINTNEENEKILNMKKDPVGETKRLMDEFVKEQKENKEQLLAPYTYMRGLAATSVVPALIEGYNYWTKLPDDTVKKIRDPLYLLYETTTLLDDLIDKSPLRRGFPPSARIYGERTWLAALAAALVSIEKLLPLNKPEVILGICRDLNFLMASIVKTDNIKHYSGYTQVDDYFKLCFGKNRSVLTMFWDVMRAYSTEDVTVELSLLNSLITSYVTINNDIQNFANQENYASQDCNNGKVFAEDITQGTFNFPILVAINKNNFNSDVIFQIVRQKFSDPSIKNYCVELVDKLHGIKETKEIEKSIYGAILEEIDRIGGNPLMVEGLEKLHAKIHDTYMPSYN